MISCILWLIGFVCLQEKFVATSLLLNCISQKLENFCNTSIKSIKVIRKVQIHNKTSYGSDMDSMVQVPFYGLDVVSMIQVSFL